MKDTDLAYLAGVVDSDGCIAVMRRRYGPSGRWYYAPRITVKQVTNEAVTLAHELGGHLYLTRAVSDTRRPLYRWEISSLQAVAALRLLLPYLRIKREQALNGIALHDERARLVRRAVPRGQPIREAGEAEGLVRFFDRSKVLNRTGVHESPLIV